MRKILCAILVLIGSNSIIIGQETASMKIYYSQAIEFIKGNSMVGKPNENYSKIRVSNQLIPFDVLGWFYQNELSQKISGGYIPTDNFKKIDYKINDTISNFSSCKKKCKFLIFFSEFKNGFLLAEVLKDSSSSDYLTATMFGQTTVFLFEYSGENLKNVLNKKVNHN